MGAESSSITSAAAAAAGAMEHTRASANNATAIDMFLKRHVLDTAAAAAVIGTVAGTADRCLFCERCLRNVFAEHENDEDWWTEQRGHSSTTGWPKSLPLIFSSHLNVVYCVDRLLSQTDMRRS